MSRLLARKASGVAVLAVLLGMPARADAFCRTTTVPISASFQPGSKCWDQGVPLFWKNSCVAYSVQRSASRSVSFDDASNHVAAAFAKWSGSTCPTDGKGQSRASIDIRNLGAVECAAVEYNKSGPNQNVIFFQDEKWPHPDSSSTIALTTVSFNPETGEIYDADMEINTYSVRVTLNDPVPQDGYDFASIVTHEAGHFLGLGHSGDVHATMYSTYNPGNTAMRNLTSDDVAGICDIYRPDGTRSVLNGKVTPGPQCDPTPRRGFTDGCAEPVERSCLASSRVAATAPMSEGWIATAVGALALVVVRRRRSHHARTNAPPRA